MTARDSARHDSARRSTSGQPKRTRRRTRRLWVAVAALIVLVVAGTGVTLALVADGDERVPDGVSVEGVSLAGMTPDEAQMAIRRRAAELMDSTVTIAHDGGDGVEFEVSRRQLRAVPRVAPALAEALEAHGPMGRARALIGLPPSREVALGFALDPGAVDRVVERVNSDFDNPPVGATLRVTDDDIEVVPGSAGVGIDEAELRTRLDDLPERIDLTTGPQPAPISDEAAAAARERALALAAEPMTVTFQERGVAVAPQVLREALRFDSRPPSIAVRFDPATIYRDIAPAFSARETEARDAAFEVRGDTIRLVPSADGHSLDMGAIANSMAAMPAGRSVRARFRITTPEVLTEELADLGIEELVGSFSTPYNCCEPRVENIAVAARTLDGTILPPGRRFSLNDALGPRTTERGYVGAPEIQGGRLVEGIGGGVSQVATTLLNAAFFAGLQIESHTPHSFYISRYPPGREATISMGGPDLVFVNDWDASLYISAVAGDNEITIRLFSTSFDRRVETTTGDRTDFREPEEIERVDASLEPGEREVDQFVGSSGFTVSYTRTIFEGDSVRREETYRWTYQPQNAYVRVGPDEPEDPPEDADDPTAPEPPTGTTAPEPSAPPAPSPQPSPAPGNGAAPPPPELP